MTAILFSPLDLVIQGACLVTILVGHAALVVLVTNWSHGLGIRWRGFERATLVFLAGCLIATLIALVSFGAIPIARWPWPLLAYAGLCSSVALVALPVTQYRIAMRRRRAELRPTSRRIDLAAECTHQALAGPGAAAWFLRVPGNESLQVELNTWRIPIPDLPLALDGLCILHLSDFHLSPAYSPRYFSRALEYACETAAPDLVAITGDLVDDDDSIPALSALLEPLVGGLGKFAILGNHDHHHDLLELQKALLESGFTVLDGSTQLVEWDGANVLIAGTCRPWGPDLTPGSWSEPADFRLLLSHTPDEIYRASRRAFDLVLAGHNHGGQVCLPWIGPVLMPSRYSRRFGGGFDRVKRTWLHTSRGLGAKYPLRIACAPEITRVVLCRVEAQADELKLLRTIRPASVLSPD
jgi:predicted MPP superfamily phosphohydrolase